jgi:hypothetical protein
MLSGPALRLSHGRDGVLCLAYFAVHSLSIGTQCAAFPEVTSDKLHIAKELLG